MTGLFQDLRCAWRQLRTNRGFAIVSVLTLALGIGANTAIFSVVNAVLLRPLPYPDSNSLVRVWSTSARFSTDVSSYPDFRDWAEQSRSFEQMAAFSGRSFNLSGSDRPQRVEGLRTTAGLFSALRVRPLLGRLFSDDEQSAGQDHIVLLTENMWKNHFNANPGILGSTLKLDDENYTVIGVLPSEVDFPPGHKVSLFVPLRPDPNRNHGFLSVLGRLRAGLTLNDAQAEMSTIALRLAEQYKPDKGQGIYLQSLQSSFVNDYRSALWVLQGAVGFVLLIACANVANLFLGKATARQRELAVRTSLGAGRRRLIQQLLCESLVVTLIGGAVGLLLATWGVGGLAGWLTRRVSISMAEKITVDGRVLLFALGVTLLTSMVSGLVPALNALKLGLGEALKEGSRSLSSGMGRKRFRSALVVSEVALALVLLSGAGLMIRSLVLLLQVDSGVRANNVLAIDFSLASAQYSKAPARAAIFQQILNRVDQIPGVRSSAVVADVPLTQNEDSLSFSIAGVPDPPNKQRQARFNVVGPNYFRTLGIPLFAGRDFTDDDNLSSPVVVVINQAMARAFWPNQNPVGERITTDQKSWYTVSGVAGDVRQMGLRSTTQPEVYISYLQDPYQWPYMSMLVRTSSDPLKLLAAVEQAVWSVDKDLPPSHPMTLDQIRSDSIAQPRVIALLLGLFAGLALVLASVGLYGVVSRSVTERTHELGVRMALGATAMGVFRLVVGQGLTLALLGSGIGLIGSLVATQALATFLFNVRPTDPITFTGVSLLLIVVTLVASYFPARRAAKVDPLVALRYE
jgi:putative ABC transport system permease protein